MKAVTIWTSLLLSTSTAALAQTPPAAAPAAPAPAAAPAHDALQDIVVTATKQAAGQSVQRVPIAITALGTKAIEANNITNISEVGRLVPSANLAGAGTFPGFANFTIRGIGLNGSNRSVDPSVAVIVDGMPYEFLLGTMLDTFDLESVEVLRGPQGILFGRNATGGAVSVRTRRPTDRLQVEGVLRAGSGSRFDQGAMIAGPISGDTILGKLTVLHRYSKGLFKDHNGGTFVPAVYNPSGTDVSPARDQVGENTWLIRPTIVIKPTTNLSITLMGEYLNQKGGTSASRLTAVPTIQQYFGYTPPSGYSNINISNPSQLNSKAWRFTGEVNWDLGPGTITSITGYRKLDYAGSFDADGTPFNIFEFPVGNSDKSRQFSQEVRFASHFSDFINVLAGGYYSNLTIDTVELRQLTSFFGGAGTTNVPIWQRGQFSQRGRSLAAFGNVDIHPMEGLKLSAGARYTRDTKNFVGVPIGRCTGPDFVGCPTAAASGKKTWPNFSPRAGVEYQINPRTLAYATLTYGFRSGAFNGRAQTVAAIGPADPEKVRTIEAGLKTTFLDGAARVNLAGYTSKYSNIQRQVTFNGINTLANAGRATLSGVELETSLIPIKGLTLTANGSIIWAHYDQFLGLAVRGVPYDPNIDPALAKNLTLDNVPKYTAYVGASYRLELPGTIHAITPRVSYTYKTHYFFDVLNEVRQPGYGLLEAGIAAEIGERFRLSFYAKNLTNAVYAEQGSRYNFGVPNTNPAGRGFIYFGGEPRNFGVELSVKY